MDLDSWFVGSIAEETISHETEARENNPEDEVPRQENTGVVDHTNWNSKAFSLNLPSELVELPATSDASVLSDLQFLHHLEPSLQTNLAHVNHLKLERTKQFKALEEELKILKLNLENYLYLHEINASYANQYELESQVVEKILQLPPPPRAPMSLFANAKGHAPPSTPEGLQKAAEKVHLPAYRKKYDWTLQIWPAADQKRLLQLVASKAQIDLAKLLVEEKLFYNKIKSKDSISELRNCRQLLDETVGVLTDKKGRVDTVAVEKRLDYLNEHLSRKFNRQQQGPEIAPPDYTPLLLIPTVPLGHVKEQNDDDDYAMEIMIKQYWVHFWDSVATAMSGKIDWSGRDCQIQWIHHISPTVNKETFSEREDMLLLEAATESGGRHWENIAAMVGTRRSAYQCFERYQRKLNKDLIKGDWTLEEDRLLISAVQAIGHELTGPSRWTRIAQRIPGRSNFQCRARYLHSLKSDLRHGEWTLKEDLAIQLLVSAYGRGRWSRLAKHLPTRTDMKCRERYENVLKPNAKNDVWTAFENRELLSAVRKFGNDNWEAVAAEMTSFRNGAECKKQFQSLQPTDSLEHQKEPFSTDKKKLSELITLMSSLLPENLRSQENVSGGSATTGSMFDVKCPTNLLPSHSTSQQQNESMLGLLPLTTLPCQTFTASSSSSSIPIGSSPPLDTQTRPSESQNIILSPPLVSNVPSVILPTVTSPNSSFVIPTPSQSQSLSQKTIALPNTPSSNLPQLGEIPIKNNNNNNNNNNIARKRRRESDKQEVSSSSNEPVEDIHANCHQTAALKILLDSIQTNNPELLCGAALETMTSRVLQAKEEGFLPKTHQLFDGASTESAQQSSTKDTDLLPSLLLKRD